MADALVALIGGRPAGTITRTAGGRLRFTYDDAYRAHPDATPLSLSMPVQVATHPDRVLVPWLWGLLPDNDAVLRRWARTYRTSATSPFGLLASPVGEDCAGAVQFARPDALERLLARPGHVEWLTDADVASRLRDLRRDTASWLGNNPSGHFSLAGAQAKTALLRADGRWGIPSGATPTSHILKPAVDGLDDHDLNEHLCMSAARKAGLLVARTSIARFDDETALVVHRYDRLDAEGRLLRVHQEDLCQAMAVHPARKYQSEGGPGPESVASLIRRVMSPSRADEAVGRFVDALAWNWLIAGTDAHAKNYSLLLSGGQARLAPLYDVASALPYWDERELRFAMKIGGDYRVASYRNTWPKAARQLKLDPGAVVDRIRDLAERATHAFADAASDPDVALLESSLPGRLVDLVAARVRRCIRLLA